MPITGVQCVFWVLAIGLFPSHSPVMVIQPRAVPAPFCPCPAGARHQKYLIYAGVAALVSCKGGEEPHNTVPWSLQPVNHAARAQYLVSSKLAMVSEVSLPATLL